MLEEFFLEHIEKFNSLYSKNVGRVKKYLIKEFHAKTGIDLTNLF